MFLFCWTLLQINTFISSASHCEKQNNNTSNKRNASKKCSKRRFRRYLFGNTLAQLLLNSYFVTKLCTM